MYSRNGSNLDWIAYHDNASGTVRRVDIPAGVLLYDKKVSGDRVFAGGTVAVGTNRHGIVACMDLNDLLSGSGQFRAITLTQHFLFYSDCPSDDYHDRITGVKRLDLFEEDGETVVCFVADNVMVTAGGDVVYHRVGDGSMSFNPVLETFYPCAYHYNKDGVEEYTDIAVLDGDCIVIVSRENQSGRFCFDLYDKKKCYAMNEDFPHHDRKYMLLDHKVEGRVLVTAVPGNRFAVACHYRDEAGATGTAVKVFAVNGMVPTLQYSVDLPLPSMSTIGDMEDICYSRAGDCLWVLHNADSPVTGLCAQDRDGGCVCWAV